MKKRARFTLWLIGLFTCTSCGDSKWHSGIDEYNIRISRILELETVSLDWKISPLLYPKKRSLIEEAAGSSIGMIDFLRLSKCDLQRLVGERNSSLGIMQKSSSALFYHARFIVLASECLALDLVPADMQKQLQQVIDKKKSELPLYMWNATFASEEFAKLMAPLGSYSPAKNSEIPSSITEALSNLNAIHRQIIDVAKSQPDMEWAQMRQAYEKALQVIASSNYLGSLTHQIRQLTQAMKQLEQLLATTKFCAVGQNGGVLISARKKDALNYVFRAFYIGELQVKAAHLARQYREWHILATNLMAGMQIPEAAESYFDQASLEYQKFEEALSWHTKFWQKRLAECGMSPGEK